MPGTHTSLDLFPGSFKIRGVVNQLQHVCTATDLSKKMLLTVSAGNYGKAFAYYLQKSELQGTCVMPITAPDNRVTLLKVLCVCVVCVCCVCVLCVCCVCVGCVLCVCVLCVCGCCV